MLEQPTAGVVRGMNMGAGRLDIWEHLLVGSQRRLHSGMATLAIYLYCLRPAAPHRRAPKS